MKATSHHLHNDEQDSIPNWFARAMSAARSGTIRLEMGRRPAVKIDIVNNRKK